MPTWASLALFPFQEAKYRIETQLPELPGARASIAGPAAAWKRARRATVRVGAQARLSARGSHGLPQPRDDDGFGALLACRVRRELALDAVEQPVVGEQ